MERGVCFRFRDIAYLRVSCSLQRWRRNDPWASPTTMPYRLTRCTHAKSLFIMISYCINVFMVGIFNLARKISKILFNLKKYSYVDTCIIIQTFWSPSVLISLRRCRGIGAWSRRDAAFNVRYYHKRMVCTWVAFNSMRITIHWCNKNNRNGIAKVLNTGVDTAEHPRKLRDRERLTVSQLHRVKGGKLLHGDLQLPWK